MAIPTHKQVPPATHAYQPPPAYMYPPTGVPWPYPDAPMPPGMRTRPGSSVGKKIAITVVCIFAFIVFLGMIGSNTSNPTGPTPPSTETAAPQADTITMPSTTQEQLIAWASKTKEPMQELSAAFYRISDTAQNGDIVGMGAACRDARNINATVQQYMPSLIRS